jgi:hypothetical protein
VVVVPVDIGHRLLVSNPVAVSVPKTQLFLAPVLLLQLLLALAVTEQHHPALLEAVVLTRFSLRLPAQAAVAVVVGTVAVVQMVVLAVVRHIYLLLGAMEQPGRVSVVAVCRMLTLVVVVVVLAKLVVMVSGPRFLAQAVTAFLLPLPAWQHSALAVVVVVRNLSVLLAVWRVTAVVVPVALTLWPVPLVLLTLVAAVVVVVTLALTVETAVPVL